VLIDQLDEGQGAGGQYYCRQQSHGGGAEGSAFGFHRLWELFLCGKQFSRNARCSCRVLRQVDSLLGNVKSNFKQSGVT
jgi:hypothetical protein